MNIEPGGKFYSEKDESVSAWRPHAPCWQIRVCDKTHLDNILDILSLSYSLTHTHKGWPIFHLFECLSHL